MKTELRNNKFFIIDDENNDIGYIDFEKNDKNITVKHTVIAKDFRGKKYGKVLVDEFLKSYPINDYIFTSQCWFFMKVLDRLK